MVAAVAGLAALAVVLVQNVVGETAEQVASHSARREAAELAAAVQQERWRADAPRDEPDAARINGLYSARCRRLGIIYADISLRPDRLVGTPVPNGGSWDREPICTLI